MKKEVINSIVNYGSTIYLIVITFICNTLYFKYMGSELYGFIALVILLTAIVSIFDFGFSVTLLRETANFCLSKNYKKMQSIIYSIEYIYLCIIFLLIPMIFLYLLNLPIGWKFIIEENGVNFYLLAFLVTLLICTRFLLIVYKAGIIGIGEIIKYNIVLVIFNSLRYFVPLIFLFYVNNSLIIFFSINLLFSLTELFVLKTILYTKSHCQLRSNILQFKNIDWSYIRNLLPFSIGIGTASIFVNILYSADRIFLSMNIDAKIFGFYSLLVLFSISLINLATPIFTSFSPKLIRLVTENKIDEMYSTFRFMTKIISLLLFLSASYLISFSSKIIYLISNDDYLAFWGNDIFIYHLVGSVFFILNSFLYYLQNAFGRFKNHLLGSFFSLLIFIPLLFYVFSLSGVHAIAKLWFYFNLVWFFSWNIISFLKFNLNFSFKWSIFDILPLLVISILPFLIVHILDLPNLFNYYLNLFLGALIFLLFFIFGLFTIHEIRSKLLYYFSIKI